MFYLSFSQFYSIRQVANPCRIRQSFFKFFNYSFICSFMSFTLFSCHCSFSFLLFTHLCLEIWEYVSVWPITRSSLTRFSFDSSRFYWSIAVSPISLFLCSRRLYRVISLDITLGSLSRINTRLREREISWLRSPFVRSIPLHLQSRFE